MLLHSIDRFHPSVEQIHGLTEGNFLTVQINTSHIYSTGRVPIVL